MRLSTRAGIAGVAVAGLLAVPAAAGWALSPSAVPSAAHPVPTAAVATMRAELRNGTLGQTHGIARVCAEHHLSCQADALTASKKSSALLISGAPIGYGANDLEKAYGLVGAKAGSGEIAVLETGAYPTLESDLAIYRATYNLPRCTVASGCIRQVNYKGGPAYTPSTDPDVAYDEEGEAMETALDVDMASAACPHCTILEVQLPAVDGAAGDQTDVDTATAHFATASQTAVRLGAKAISISYGYPTDSYTDHEFPAKAIAHNGVAVIASTGDSGVNVDGNLWPSDLTTVIAAGGTALYVDPTNARGYTETAWSDDEGDGTGSGCSFDLGPAFGQPDSVSSACYGSRADSDISADADPITGVAVYDSYAPATGTPVGFGVFGGTSASAPFVAGMYVRAGVRSAVLGPNELYAASPSRFNDVVIGQTVPTGVCASYFGFDDRICTAGPGWDGPTGLGTPKGLSTFIPAS
jgi:hypothetical protein